MLLLRTDALPEGDEWLYELKLDGYRALAIKTGGKIQLRSRNDNDSSGKYPSIVKALGPAPDETVLDGELVAFPSRRPSFNVVQKHLAGHTDLLLTVRCFGAGGQKPDERASRPAARHAGGAGAAEAQRAHTALPSALRQSARPRRPSVPTASRDVSPSAAIASTKPVSALARGGRCASIRGRSSSSAVTRRRLAASMRSSSGITRAIS
jgi:hypothetical protein